MSENQDSLISGEKSHPKDAIPHEDLIVFGNSDAKQGAVCSFLAFNTLVSITVFAESTQARAVLESAAAECRRFERLFSRTLPNSDISKLNRARGAATKIERDTFAVLEAAKGYCEASCGTFDVTIGPATRLWDFGKGVAPDPAALADAVTHVDWRNLKLTQAGRCFVAQLEDPDAAVDVGGIAKGYIADRLTEVMEQEGVASFIINLGGNVVVRGSKPKGDGWRIGLRDPRKAGSLVGTVELYGGCSAVTSGIYERCFVLGGRLFHHILDPGSGYPVETDVAGVTVLAERSIDAEGYSTTLLALGLKNGLKFASENPAIIAAYFVDLEGRILRA